MKTNLLFMVLVGTAPIAACSNDHQTKVDSTQTDTSDEQSNADTEHATESATSASLGETTVDASADETTTGNPADPDLVDEARAACEDMCRALGKCMEQDPASCIERQCREEIDGDVLAGDMCMRMTTGFFRCLEAVPCSVEDPVAQCDPEFDAWVDACQGELETG